jgi:hypothetical protein
VCTYHLINNLSNSRSDGSFTAGSEPEDCQAGFLLSWNLRELVLPALAKG